MATLPCLVAKRYDILSEHNRVNDCMHRLPLELKNYIFQLALPQDEWGGIAIEHRIVMTTICKHWRDIALSNPFLWSTICIILRERASTSAWLNSLHDWILRSRALLLTLHIVAFDRASEEEWRRLLDVIGPSSNRRHSLSLDIPFNLLHDSRHSNLNLQYNRLRRLHICCSNPYFTGPFPLLNPTMSPEEIDINGLSFRTLQISWNHLTSAKVEGFGLEEIAQLFQHASRMTNCHISAYEFKMDFSMPPIIHRSLKELSLADVADYDVTSLLLDSLTLPCLQEFHTDDIFLLTPEYLPALVDRSSCPMTRIRLSLPYRPEPCLNLIQPLVGVTDLVMETVTDVNWIEQLLFEEPYLPDLRHLILRLRPFLFLWNLGIISKFLDDREAWPSSNGPNPSRIRKILVVDQDCAEQWDEMWKSNIGKQLKSMKIILKEDGFEILRHNMEPAIDLR